VRRTNRHLFRRWRTVPYGARKGDMPTKRTMRVYDDMAVDGPKSARARERRWSAFLIAEAHSVGLMDPESSR